MLGHQMIGGLTRAFNGTTCYNMYKKNANRRLVNTDYFLSNLKFRYT